MRITTNGKVGMGVVNPNAKLTVNEKTMYTQSDMHDMFREGLEKGLEHNKKAQQTMNLLYAGGFFILGMFFALMIIK